MKITCSLALAFMTSLAFAGAVQGQNLIVNGDFESGVITPWIPTGDVQIGNGLYAVYGIYSCGMGLDANGSHAAKIEQTIATTAGSFYYLALDIVGANPNGFSDYTISAVPAAGGNADGSFMVQVSNNAAHRTLFFHATTASTKIVIDMSGAQSVVDNIQLIALPPNKHAGKYTGTAQTVLASDANGVANKESTKLVARIAPTGQIVVLEGGTEFDAGTLLPDGTLDIRLRGGRHVFTTAIRGTRIQFTLVGSPNLFDEGGNQLDPVIRTTYTLTRVQ